MEQDFQKITIGELVSFPPVKTVIHLRDSEDPQLNRQLASSFVFTNDVQFCIRVVLDSIASRSGRGFFLTGNFGTGKSHFLVVLSLIASGTSALRITADIDPTLQSLIESVSKNPPLVVSIPLQEHGNEETLEQVVLSRIAQRVDEQWGATFAQSLHPDAIPVVRDKYAEELEAYRGQNQITEEAQLIEQFIKKYQLPFQRMYERRQFIPQLQQLLQSHACPGVLLLMDELSEFVRAKVQPRMFTEDIRFLQFLGEAASEVPLWVIAAQQERLEETGAIPEAVFHKIKDRFHRGLRLTGRHIAELVPQYLVVKNNEAAAHISRVYQHIRGLFGSLPFSETEFIRLFPIHPWTITFLDELQLLFSQHRGVVDFIHYSMAGDAKRNIPSRTGEPLTWMLTPDYIFDHFRDRIRELYELNRLHDVVYHYYQHRLEDFFDDPVRANCALRLIKILILARLFPTPRDFTAEELAFLILHPVTDLDPRVNIRYIESIIETLVTEGAYVNRAVKDGEPRYFIDITYDVKVVVQRRIEEVERELFDTDPRYFTLLRRAMEDPVLPLHRLALNEPILQHVRWLNSRRNTVVLIAADPDGEWCEALSSQMSEQPELTALIILSPLRPEEDMSSIVDALMKHRRGLLQGCLFWVPHKLEVSPELKAALARCVLEQRLQSSGGDGESRLLEYLQEQVQRDKVLVQEHFRRCYFHGDIVDSDGQLLHSLDQFGALPFAEMLNRIMSYYFRERFPKHSRIAALHELYQSSRLDELITHFFRHGEWDDQRGGNVYVRSIIDGYLKPMKLIRRERHIRYLQCDPAKSELVKFALEQISNHRLSYTQWEERMRQSAYGLTQGQVELLLASLLFSGSISAFIKDRKLDPARTSAVHLKKISHIALGDLISADRRQLLLNSGVVPEALHTGGVFSVVAQQQYWNWLCENKWLLAEELDSSVHFLESLKQHHELPFNVLRRVNVDATKLRHLVGAIDSNLDSCHGLTKFTDFLQNEPRISEDWRRFKGISEFIATQGEALQLALHYLKRIPLDRLKQIGKRAEETGSSASGDSGSSEEWAALHDLLQSSLERLQKGEWLQDAEAVGFFLSQCQKGIQRYRELYEQAHHRFYRGNKEKVLSMIEQSRPFRLLQTLNRLSFVSPHPSFETWRKRIREMRQQQCSAPIREILRQAPRCSCGFLPDESSQTLDPATAIRELEEGVRATIRHLRGSGFGELISQPLETLEQTGRGESALALREFLSLTGDEHDLLDRCTRLLRKETLAAVSDAMQGRITVHVRELASFVEQIQGRILPLEELFRIFREWVALDEERAFVKIEGFSMDTTVDAGISAPVVKRVPALKGLLHKVGGEILSHWLCSLFWLQLRELSPAKVAALCPEVTEQFSEDELRNTAEIVSEELREQGAFAAQCTFGLDGEEWRNRLFRFMDAAGAASAVDFVLTEKHFPWIVVAALRETLLEQLRGEAEVAGDFRDKAAGHPLIVQSEEARKLCRVIDKVQRYRRGMGELMGRDLSAMDEPETWEGFFTGTVASLPLLFSQVSTEMKSLGLAEYLPLLEKQSCELQIGRANEAFRVMLQRYGVAEEERLEAFIGKWGDAGAKGKGRRAIYLFLIDGMRFDLWLELDAILGREYGLRRVEKQVLWSHVPTTTEVQLESLRSKGLYSIINLSRGEQAWAKMQPFPHLGQTIVKIDVLDERIHTSRDPLALVYSDVLPLITGQLEPVIQRLTKEDRLVIFSDHGFEENPDYSSRDKYQSPRYLHGKDSLFEVLVPAGAYQRLG